MFSCKVPPKLVTVTQWLQKKYTKFIITNQSSTDVTVGWRGFKPTKNMDCEVFFSFPYQVLLRAGETFTFMLSCVPERCPNVTAILNNPADSCLLKFKMTISDVHLNVIECVKFFRVQRFYFQCIAWHLNVSVEK
jgi:hypothetical protein